METGMTDLDSVSCAKKERVSQIGHPLCEVWSRIESIMQNDRWKKQSEEQNLLLVSYSVCKIKAVNHKRFAALNIVISAFPFLHSVVRYLTPVRLQSYRPRDLVSLLPEKFHPVFY